MGAVREKNREHAELKKPALTNDFFFPEKRGSMFSATQIRMIFHGRN
jgi:hypothetical protein